MRKKARQSTHSKPIREVSSIYGPVFWELKPSSSQVSRPAVSHPLRPSLHWAVPAPHSRPTSHISLPIPPFDPRSILHKSSSWDRKPTQDRPLTDRPKRERTAHRRTVTSLTLAEREREGLGCDPRRKERRSLPVGRYFSRVRLRSAGAAGTGEDRRTAGEVNPSPWGGESTTTEGVSLSFSLLDYKGE